ncbi:MAG: hypothetical protein IPK82_23865 [Polyangiaceae bacterium]|nr:hypothetical protein [Polyangiaceae bacterium]
MLNFLPDKAGESPETVLGEKGAAGFSGKVYSYEPGFDPTKRVPSPSPSVRICRSGLPRGQGGARAGEWQTLGAPHSSPKRARQAHRGAVAGGHQGNARREGRRPHGEDRGPANVTWTSRHPTRRRHSRQSRR